jgi:hypothetical protein
VLFAKVVNALGGIYQRVTNNLWHPAKNLLKGCQYPLTPCNKFARGLPTTYLTFARGLPKIHTMPLKKVEFKVKNQEAIDSYKNYHRFIFI